jgi:hypothetical protein
MPNCRNIPSMPNVLDSSGTIGTTRGPMALSRSSVFRIRTNAIVVEIWRPGVPPSWPPNADSSGTGSDSVDFCRRDGR